MDEQQENLDRVCDKIAPLVLEFLSTIGAGNCFYLEQLQRHIRAIYPTSPDSPSRILRYLRQSHKIDYVVVSRRDSHYRFLGVPATAPPGLLF